MVYPPGSAALRNFASFIMVLNEKEGIEHANKNGSKTDTTGGGKPSHRHTHTLFTGEKYNGDPLTAAVSSAPRHDRTTQDIVSPLFFSCPPCTMDPPHPL